MIPRTFHHIWVGGPIPEHLTDYIESWQRVHPDWSHRLWTDGDLDWLTNQTLFDRVDEIVGPAEVGQLRSDIARLEILARHGGVYIDCDMEARKPFDPLLGVGCFAGFEDPERRWMNNAVLGAVPQHPFISALLEQLPRSVESARRAGIRRPNRFSGPQFVTPIWSNWFRDQVTVHPHTHFYPYSFRELNRQGEDFPDAYAIHHWNHRRETRRG